MNSLDEKAKIDKFMSNCQGAKKPKKARFFP